MALDPRITRAIRDVAKEEGQPAKVAERLITWIEALHDGQETLADTPATNRRLSDLFDAAQPTEGE